MADTPKGLVWLAAIANTAFAGYWWQQILKSSTPAPADALPNGVGRTRLWEPEGSGDVRAIRAARAQRGGGASLAQLTAKGVSAKRADIGPIEGRVGVIRELIRQYTGMDRRANNDPAMAKQIAYWKERVTEILSEKCGSEYCIPEKDWEGETRAIFNYVRKRVRYTRDPSTVDVFSSPDRTLKTGGGDCDDMAILGATLLICAGQRVKLRVIHTKDAPTWNHIYLVVNPANDGRKWIAFDASMNKPLGWEAPGAKESARDGKPHGIVLRVKDFAV